jgi:hypothetical protein
MSGIYATMTSRGQAAISSLDNTRLRAALAVLAILIAFAILVVTLATTTATHPHVIPPGASGQVWIED